MDTSKFTHILNKTAVREVKYHLCLRRYHLIWIWFKTDNTLRFVLVKFCYAQIFSIVCIEVFI
jgi:hypothetical protein